MEYLLPALVALGVTSIVAAILFFVLCFGKIGCGWCRCWKRRSRDQDSLESCKKCHFVSSRSICSNEVCPVCLDDFPNGAKIVVTPCFHGFHKDCLLQCKHNSPYCPLCKVRIFQTDPEETPLLDSTTRS